jgi:transcriptional regulator with XRE-family HTH domain
MNKKLRQQREMVGWSQFELARASGLAPGRVSFAETGRVKLNDEEVARVKRALARRAKAVSEEFAVA